MGYVEQPATQYMQDGVVPVSVNGVPGVMPVGMPAPQGGVPGAPMAVMTGITRVYVGNLSWETEWQDLKDHMRAAGEVRWSFCIRAVAYFKLSLLFSCNVCTGSECSFVFPLPPHSPQGWD